MLEELASEVSWLETIVCYSLDDRPSFLNRPNEARGLSAVLKPTSLPSFPYSLRSPNDADGLVDAAEADRRETTRRYQFCNRPAGFRIVRRIEENGGLWLAVLPPLRATEHLRCKKLCRSFAIAPWHDFACRASLRCTENIGALP
jgi:hypothetical protein